MSNNIWNVETRNWMNSLKYKPKIGAKGCLYNEEIDWKERVKTNFKLWKMYLDEVLVQVTVNGLYAEFGVFRGRSLEVIASKIHPKIIHGFDSLQGLPEKFDMTNMGSVDEKIDTGHFALKEPPVFKQRNIKLHVGLFENSLPLFLQKYYGPFSFIHIDCDVYSSTKTLLCEVAKRIVPGTIIAFDEFWNHCSWKQNEWKAFMESCEEFGWEFKMLYYLKGGYQVSLVITKVK